MAEPSKKEKKAKLRMKDPKRLVILVLIIVIIIIVIIANKNKIKKKENMSFVLNNQDIIGQLEEEVIIKDNVTYLSYNDIKKLFDKNMCKEDEIILTGNDKKSAALEIGKKEIEINGSTIGIKGTAFKSNQGTIYLPISEMKSVYDIEFLYIEEYKNIVIDNLSKKQERATLKRTTLLKEKMDESADNLEKIENGDWIIYISEENSWAKIRTQNGNIGYVKKDVLEDFIVERDEMQEKNETANDISYYSKDITKKNIDKYKNRKKVIEEILIEAVNQNKQAVKIIYKKDKDKQNFKRFKLESTAFLKECGITTIFE